jgi:3-mercaptopyruvate sulfurtransferase SseA
MALPLDPAPKFQEYAHPEMIVSTEWVAQHLDDPGLVVAESDEDVLLYETGHVPGAVKLDWHTELNDPVTRDYVDGAAFARLMSEKGISRDTTLVLYGDKKAGPSGWPRAARSAPTPRSPRPPTTRRSSGTISDSVRSRTRSWRTSGSR